VSVYSWPISWAPSAFELRLLSNTRSFIGPYTPSTQVLDLMGERWNGRIDLTPTEDQIEGGRREAFFDRLKGGAHQFAIWNFRRPVPLGTVAAGQVAVPVVNASSVTVNAINASSAVAPCVAGDPVLLSAVPLLANTCTIQTRAGRTVYAGDMLSLGGVQTVRVMADATADANGFLTVEFQPRARGVIPAYAAITTYRPLITVMLKADGVPTTWHPGFADGASFEFVEVP